MRLLSTFIAKKHPSISESNTIPCNIAVSENKLQMVFSRLQRQTVCNLHSNSKNHKRHPLLASKHQQETTLPKRFPVGAKILGQNEFKFVHLHNDMCRGQKMNSPDSPGSQATPAFHQNPLQPLYNIVP